MLKKTVLHMEERYALFQAEKVQSIDEYHQKRSQTKLPRYIIVIEEFSQLMDDKATSKTFETSVKKLAEMGRACGIHLMIATQRPEANILTPTIRDNIPVRILLKTASEAQSRIIASRSDFTQGIDLLGKGDMFLFCGDFEPSRLQGFYLDSSWIQKLERITR